MWARGQEEREKGGVPMAGLLGEAHTESSVNGGGEEGSSEQTAPSPQIGSCHMVLVLPKLPFPLQSEHNLVTIRAPGTVPPHPDAHRSEKLCFY